MQKYVILVRVEYKRGRFSLQDNNNDTHMMMMMINKRSVLGINEAFESEQGSI